MQTLNVSTLETILPKCPHAGVCGGCSSQHIPYNLQLLEKEKKLAELFPEVKISSIVGAIDPWRYRGKMEFSFRQDKQKNRYLGLMRVNGMGSSPFAKMEKLRGVRSQGLGFCWSWSNKSMRWLEYDGALCVPEPDKVSSYCLTRLAMTW